MNIEFHNIKAFLFSFVATLLVSCAAPTEVMKQESPSASAASSKTDSAVVDVAAESSNAKLSSSTDQPKAEIYRGTGDLINKNPKSRSKRSYGQGDDVSLMFQDAPITEVATTILGDLMGMAYVLDERVTGTVSLKTGRPIPRNALVAVMEGILKANNAVLLDNDGIFHIVPSSENLSSVVSPSFSLDSDKGYQIIVVPLRYIAADEMKNILGSIQGADAKIQTDARRNLILVSGTQSELKNMLDTIEIFDVDQLKGMSTGIFRLSQADSITVSNELRTIFNFSGQESEDLPSIIKFVPIERINAVLVITPQARYLDTVEQWVQRLDQVDSSITRLLHVYFVQNVRAAYLAGILQELFDADVSTQGKPGFTRKFKPGIIRQLPV